MPDTEPDTKPGTRSSTRSDTARVLYWPPVETADELSRWLAHARWHFGDRVREMEVVVPLASDRLAANLPSNLKGLDAAHPVSARAGVRPRGGDTLLFRTAQAFWSSPARLRRQGLMLDPYVTPAPGDLLGGWLASRFETTGPSRRVWNALVDGAAQASRVVLVGSGQRARVQGNAREPGFNIYLGTAVYDDKLCEAYPPHVVLASDGPSQFADNAMSRLYRKVVSEWLSESGWMVVPEDFRTVMESHWPAALVRRTLFVPSQANLPPDHRLSDRLAFEPTSNVLTALGLPLAASLGRPVGFVGVTLPEEGGRAGNPVDAQADVHWAHADEAGYLRLVAELMVELPASVLVAPGYKRSHLRRLRRTMDALAKTGVRFEDASGRPLRVGGGGDHVRPMPDRRQGMYDLLVSAELHPARFAFAVAAASGLAAAGLCALMWREGRDLENAVPVDFAIVVVTLAMLGGATALLFVYLRVRMNRMVASVESRLSQQQANQFANLSNRLQAVEMLQSPAGQDDAPE